MAIFKKAALRRNKERAAQTAAANKRSEDLGHYGGPSMKVAPLATKGEAETAKPKLAPTPAAKAPEKKAETFGEAFKRNRAAGAKTFTHNGKSYTTQTKEEAAKAKPAAKPEAKAPEKKAEPLKESTAFAIKKATGNQLIERAKAVVPPSVYTRPGKGTAKPIGNRPPAKSAAQKFGGKTKKK